MSSPSKMIVPDVGAMRPQIRLTKVVLPAPFGPMMARISPGRSVEVDVLDRLAGRRSSRLKSLRGQQRRHGSHRSPAVADGPENALREEQRPAGSSATPTISR